MVLRFTRMCVHVEDVTFLGEENNVTWTGGVLLPFLE